MRISLQSIHYQENHTLTLDNTISMDAICQEIAGLVELTPVHVQVTATKTNANLYRVKGKQEAQAKFVCSRCLQAFSMPLVSDWEAQFTEEAEMAHEIDGQEVQLLEPGELDLTPFVRESLLLQIPYAPICREDCQGLCPVCGVDRNHTACQCEQKAIDPRLAKLQDFAEED